MKKILVFFFLLIAVPLSTFATHNRAGEIVYRHVNNFTYEVSINTCTKTSSLADRDFLELDWGDGTPLDSIYRDSVIFLANDAQRNVYIGQHTYVGPGVYNLNFEDPNRNAGVVNIPNSVQEPFCVKTQLIISAQTGHNNSVVFLNPPKTVACFQKRWVYNAAAYDVDGDSLSFEPMVCLGFECDPIPGYQFPNEIIPGPNNNWSMNTITGDIVWDASQLAGEYNIAFKVTEWRKAPGTNIPVVVGWVMRDMQITVGPCANNPPVLELLSDTCIEAGQFLTFGVSASDQDGDDITLSAYGAPFLMPTSPAQFNSPNPSPNVTGTFNWQTICDHVSISPYQAIFKAKDDDPQAPLEDFGSIFITIVAPAPENTAAAPDGSSITLTWDPSICTNANGYKIYRRAGAYGYVHGPCETGVPSYTGYTLLATTSGLNSTTFVDDQNLIFGNEYCYMIVACFPDGAQSYASEEFCAALLREFPLITNVSVGFTDPGSGIDTIRWVNATELDTTQFPGPYFFELYRSVGYGSATTLIYTSPQHAFLDHPDTSFNDVGINTEDEAHTYRVELHNGNGYIGESNLASSMYLDLIPNDEQLELIWTALVPWSNYQYEIYRWDGVSQFVFIGTSNTESYLDTNLINGEEYCYYVKSIGEYTAPGTPTPLINFSQEQCGVPQDLTPPCAPDLELTADCDLEENTLVWNNPNNTCSDDAASYNVYFSPLIDTDLELIASLRPATDTTYVHYFQVGASTSIAGCYAITAIDSVGNESEYSNIECVDNCPEYTLPNVFTPNQDGQNDFFVPFPYKFVESIDLQVYNRWGQIVFTTLDPDIVWDGVHMESKEICSDGVYFYTCVVNTITLQGILPITLTGYVHLLKGNKSTVN